jgi:outer membrane protein
MRALACFLLLSQSASANKYTLQQLLDRVKAEYPSVTAARESAIAADAQVAQAWRLWAPIGSLTGGFTLAPSIKCEDANGFSDSSQKVREANCIQTSTNTASVSNSGVFNLTNPAFRFDVQLTQPIYTSGKIESAVKAAKAGRDVARSQIDAAIADAQLNAVKAYWGLKWARAADATLTDGHDRVKEWVEHIDKALNASGSSGFTEQDLSRLKIALSTVDLGLVDIQRAETVALDALRTVAVDPTADIDDEELDSAEVVEHPLDYYEEAATVHRPEARMLDAGTRAVKSLRQLRLSEMLPDIGLYTEFSYTVVPNVDTPNNSFMNHPNSTGFSFYLGLRQPLDLVQRAGKYQQARAEERAFAAKRQEALGGIALEIERAFADVGAARKRNELTAHGEKIARGWYNSVDQILQVGVADSKDLVDAARSYFELRLKHLEAIMDLNVSLAALKRAAGVD